MNKMREIRIEKICINIGVGEAGEKIKKAKALVERLTNCKATITKGKKKAPALGVRPGMPIGVKVTVRRGTEELLKRLLEAKEGTLKKSSFTNGGVSFGIEEYLHIPGMDYDPQIGIFGMDVNVVFSRPGYRVARRKIKKSKIGKNHLIKKEECIKFMQEKFGVKVV